MDQLAAIERRRRNLRIVLFGIILITLPFYCAGFVLWGTAPQRSNNVALTRPANNATQARITPQPSQTRPPNATITPRPTAGGVGQPLPPTPGQFVPPPVVTRFLSPTPVPPTATIFIPPTSTLAPSLTPFPSDTPTFTPTVPTNTPLPPPPPDTDGDTFTDDIDACPLEPGTNGGCPLPPTAAPVDSDGDTVTDDIDLCPIQPGDVANNGCPLLPPP